MNLNHENSTEIYIRKCKKFIEAEKTNPTTNENSGKTSNNPNSYASKNPNTNTNSNNTTTTNSKSTSNTNVGLTDEDRECIRIIKEKNYYKILNVSQSADENEIKKSYKKVKKKFKI